LRFFCKHIGLSIQIDDTLVNRLCRLASKHYPKEYGGLFVGRYVNNNKVVIVEESVLPKKFKSSSFSFERGVEGLRKALGKYFRATPSLIYVGEWHAHPDGQPIPSSTDTSALREIAGHHEVSINNPVLLIIGVRGNHYQLAFYVLYQNQVHRYEMEQEPVHEEIVNLNKA